MWSQFWIYNVISITYSIVVINHYYNIELLNFRLLFLIMMSTFTKTIAIYTTSIHGMNIKYIPVNPDIVQDFLNRFLFLIISMVLVLLGIFMCDFMIKIRYFDYYVNLITGIYIYYTIVNLIINVKMLSEEWGITRRLLSSGIIVRRRNDSPLILAYIVTLFIVSYFAQYNILIN